MNKATMGKLKGTNLYPAQIQAIDFVRNSTKDIIGIRGDTGTGKTCLAFESVETPFFYVCSSINLQHQAESDYRKEAVLLKGRSNYDCDIFGTADLCMLKKRCGGCEYEDAKTAALKQYDMSILNFHYFLSAANFTKNFPIRNVIIDEADTLDTTLVDFIAFDFQLKALKNWGFKLDAPGKKTVISVVESWLDEVRYQCEGIIDKLSVEIGKIIGSATYGSLADWQMIKLRRWQRLKSLSWKLEVLTTQNLKQNWIYQYQDLVGREKVVLKPKWLSRELVDKFLLSHGKRFLLMSATLPAKPVLCGLFGLEAEEIDYIDLPNVWESNDRKVVYRGKYSLSYKDKSGDTDGIIKESVKEILKEHKGRGLIHTVNYKLSELMEGLDDRLLVHNGKNKSEMFKEFLATPGAVFVSPSSTRGLDLPNELCEFIIMLKAPFLQLADPQVKARLYGSGKFGTMWYTDDTIRTIIQASGRGFRHEQDKCITFLLDKQIGRLLKESTVLWPLGFRDLIVMEEEVDEA